MNQESQGKQGKSKKAPRDNDGCGCLGFTIGFWLGVAAMVRLLTLLLGS